MAHGILSARHSWVRRIVCVLQPPLASGKLRWEFAITHELGLEALPGMFDAIRGKNEYFSKVMFKP